MKPRLGFLALLLVLTGCASDPGPAGPGEVRVTRNPEQTKFCKFLGDLTEISEFGAKNAEDRMRAKTADLGGDTLYIGPASAQSKLSGQAFRCVPDRH